MARPASPLIPPFSRPASRVAIRRVPSYQADLSAMLYETLREFDLPVRGKAVLLKPNLVGSRSPRNQEHASRRDRALRARVFCAWARKPF